VQEGAARAVDDEVLRVEVVPAGLRRQARRARPARSCGRACAAFGAGEVQVQAGDEGRRLRAAPGAQRRPRLLQR
jgi:hypothetical protein